MKKSDQTALKTFYTWLIEKASEYEDGQTGIWRCLEQICEDLELPQDICDWACRRFQVEEALAAGIPMEVIEREEKLTDVFPDEYIKAMKGKT